MPDKDLVVTGTTCRLWWRARMMHAWEPENPFPTLDEAAYLYDVASVSRRKGIFRNRTLIIRMEKQPLMDRKVHE
jgi:hypothetical protein